MKKFLILPVLLLAACSCPDNGEVMNSRYNPAWVQIIPPTPSTCSGKPPVCTPGMPMQTYFWPETWELELQNSTDRGWHEVSHDEYDRCTRGKYYPQCGESAK